MTADSLPLFLSLSRAWCQDHLQTAGTENYQSAMVEKSRTGSNEEKCPPHKRCPAAKNWEKKKKQPTDLWSSTDATTQTRVIHDAVKK